MPQVLRSADDRVAADVERLAAAYNADAVAAAAETAAKAHVDDLSLLVATYGESAVASARLTGRVVTHVGRYRTLYAVAAVVAGVLVFKSPLPPPVTQSDEATSLLPTADAQRAGSPAVDDGAPLSVVPDGPLDLTVPDGGPVSLEASSVAEPPAVVSAAPAALRITQSGYASTFAGLEQAPTGDGLTVEALAGSTTKLSFVRLAGASKTLRLRMLTDGNASLNDAMARVQACHITTANWRPQRGVTTSEAPAYDRNDCVEGARNGTLWTFAFALRDPADRNGWAIVPITTDNGTFRVTFAPAAV